MVNSSNQLKTISLILGLAMQTAIVNASDIQSNDPMYQAMIDESIQSYSGRCPCPYSMTKDGNACGNQSAYSKGNKQNLVCYESDITTQMVDDFKGRDQD